MEIILPIVIGGIAGNLVGRACEKRKSRKLKSKYYRSETYSSSRTSLGTYGTPEERYGYGAGYLESAYQTPEEPYGYGYLESSTPNYDPYPGAHQFRGYTSSPVDYPFPPPIGPRINGYRSPHCRTCHHGHPTSAPCFANYDPFQSMRPKWQWCSRCSTIYDQTSARNSERQCNYAGCTSPIGSASFGSTNTNANFDFGYCTTHMRMLYHHYMSEKMKHSDQFSNRGLIEEGPTARPYLLTDGYGTT